MHLASQEKTVVPRVSRLEEFLKNTHLIFCLLNSSANLCFKTLACKWRNGKSLKKRKKWIKNAQERGEELVLCNISSRRHHKDKWNSFCLLNEVCQVILSAHAPLGTVIPCTKRDCVFSVLTMLTCYLYTEWRKSEDKICVRELLCQQVWYEGNAIGSSLHCQHSPRNAHSAVPARQSLWNYWNFCISPVDSTLYFFLSLRGMQMLKQILY